MTLLALLIARLALVELPDFQNGCEDRANQASGVKQGCREAGMDIRVWGS
ncbi:MAG: hypothetical protein IPP88_18275 [Betaproteobacteria bacterium]|nr:hypothetical protein [Betaproteobacteria bacterium]